MGRRPLLLFANIGCGITWIGMTVSSAVFNESGSTNAGAAKATLGFIYIFSFIFSIGFTPLQALYPVEVLSFEMRAKGMAFSNLAVSAGGLLNQFAWPVSLDKVSQINQSISKIRKLTYNTCRSAGKPTSSSPSGAFSRLRLSISLLRRLRTEL